MNQALGDAMSERFAKDEARAKEALATAPSERTNQRISHPGKYVVSVGEFVWIDKSNANSHVLRPSPEVTFSRNGALILNVSLKVSDKGTDITPTGASIFHTITLLPVTGADDKKFENTIRMMKPQLTALLGHDKIDISKKWIDENLCIEFKEKNGKNVITKHHAMCKKVYITVEVQPDKNNKPRLKVVQLDKLMPGDKSITFKIDEEALAEMGKGSTSSIPSNIDISPTEEAGPSGASKGKALNASAAIVTEEDF